MADILETSDGDDATGGPTRRPTEWRQALKAFHADESGVAATEYIAVFSLITFGATSALLFVTAYVKAYRDFMVWWYAHPAI